MTKNSKQFMSAFALSAAALFLGGCKKTEPTTEPTAEPAVAAPTANADEDVKCFGINSCTGESACAVNKPDLGIEHACAGENACEGKGWIKVTRSECETKSGEVLGVL
jgi:PBP1b-binding outer membrane lipoprotein LpoB